MKLKLKLRLKLRLRDLFLAGVCLATVAGFAIPTLAKGVDVNVGYSAGNYDAGGVMGEEMSGPSGTGQLSLGDSFGVWGQAQLLHGSNLSVLGNPVPDGVASVDATRLDLLGTYTLPKSGIKLAGGYTTTNFTGNTVDDNGNPVVTQRSVSGFLAGGLVDLPIADRLSVSGFYGIGLGMKDHMDGYADADTDLTTYRLAARYQLSDAVALEGGYQGSSYTNRDDSNFTETNNGYFLGARAVL